MGAPFNSVSEAQDKVNELEEYGHKLEAQIVNLQKEMASVNDIRTGTLRWIASKQAASPNDGSRPITVEDIKHCRTQRAVLREWALRNGGYARITDVAEFIMETDLPTGEKDSVRSSLTNYAKESDLWQYHSPGVYVLLEAIRSSQADSTEQDAENQSDPDAGSEGEATFLPVLPGDLPASLVVDDKDQKQCA